MPPPPAFPPLSATPDALWRAALLELQPQMLKATYNAWLADSRVLAPYSRLTSLVIAVRNQFAQEWLACRLAPVITRTLAGIAGHPVAVSFVCENYANDSLANRYKPPSALQPTPLTSGDDPMTQQTFPSPTRVRIASHVTQSRFLHVEDALSIGKIRLFAGTYHRGQGMETCAHHFLDLADARVIFAALARGEPGFSHKEYKGTPMPTHPDRAAVSRVLSIATRGENVYVELKSGPGRLTETGAIVPHGKPEVAINVGFKQYEARRLAAVVLAYIHAWDVLRIMVNQQMVSQPIPYATTLPTTGLLAAATGSTDGLQRAPANGTPQPDGVTRPSVVVGNGRPMTRKDPVPKGIRESAPAARKRTHGQAVHPAPVTSDQLAGPDTITAGGQPLKYSDGSAPDAANLTEMQTFQQYVAEKKAAPASKTVLLAYYRRHTQAPSISTP